MQHPLERRAALLANRLTERVNTMAESLTAAQGRVPFRTQLSTRNALDWWAQHRYDALGEQALGNLGPLGVAQLDLALTQHTQDKAALGLPVETDPQASDPNTMAAASGAPMGG